MRFLHVFNHHARWKFIRGWAIFSLLLVGWCTSAQQVSLSVTNAPLEQVFNQVKKQTGYTFLYTSEEVRQAKPVTASFRNLALSQALQTIFAGQPLRYNIDQTYIVVQPAPRITPVETMEIRGRVVDEDGSGIGNVSVTVKDTQEGTSTEKDGTFRLKTERRPVVVLQFTAIGYEPQQREVGESRNLTLILKTAVSKLDEQVVIAYGSTTRRLSTGTVGKINGEEIARQPVSNALLAMSGRVPGLQVTQNSGVPGSEVTVLLRGQNSLANGNNPLYIVDGIPFPSGTLSSSYGGGAGIASSPLNNLSTADIQSIEVLKDADATAIYGSRGANGVILITTKKGRAGKTVADVNVYRGSGAPTRTMDLLKTPDYLRMRREAFKNDGVNPTAANARDLLVWDTTRYTDWQKVLIGNTATVTSLNATVSGGSAFTQFLLGSGYRRETTVFSDRFGETKVSAQASVNHTTADSRFRLSFQGHFTHTETVLPQTDLTSFITLAPNAPRLYDSAGGLNWENSTWTNPLSYFEKQYKTNTETLIANLLLEWRVTRHLSLKSNFGYTATRLNELITTPFKSYNPAFYAFAYVYTGFGNNEVKTAIMEPQATYQGSFGKKGKLTLLVGSTVQRNRQAALLQTGYGFTSDETIENIKAASSVTVDNANNVDYKYLGVFSRLSIDWNAKYILNATARRDGSSRFGPENRFSTFGSLGMAWMFSREKALAPFQRWLSFGKLRGSLGVTGNDQIGDYRYLSTYTPYTYPYQGIAPLYPTRLLNPSYQWEKVDKKELSLELGFCRDRLLLTTNYYHNRTSNQLVEYSLPTMTGFSGILVNSPATIRNTGWELELSAVAKKTKDMEWTAALSVTFPKNKLLAYDGLANSSYASTYEVGQPLFIAKRYHYLGVDPVSGLYVFDDIDKDGRITAAGDQKAIVNLSQQYFGGLQNTLKLKDWQLGFFIQFVGQEKAPNYLARFTSKPGAFANQPDLVTNRWQKPGDLADVQRFSNSNALTNAAFSNLRFSDHAFGNASFARLKNLFLSYDLRFGGQGADRSWSARFYLQAQNLITITRYAGLDPETRSVLPPLKLVTGGLQLTF